MESEKSTKKIVTTQKDAIYKKLREYQKECKNELCWLKMVDNHEKKHTITKNNFATLQPKNWRTNEKEWLSNYDISRVLKQYKETYSDFTFIEPSPIDFDTKDGDKCVTEEICKLNLQDYLNKGIKKIAIPLNLDKHTGKGFHWVTLYIDLKKKFVYYFDSANNKIPIEVEKLVKRLKEQINLKELNNQSVQHQKGNTECGMYSLFFIITMLTGKTDFSDNMTVAQKLQLFRQKKIPDKYVEKYRNIYFNN